MISRSLSVVVVLLLLVSSEIALCQTVPTGDDRSPVRNEDDSTGREVLSPRITSLIVTRPKNHRKLLAGQLRKPKQWRLEKHSTTQGGIRPFRPKTNGQIEVGGSYGMMPFTVEGGSLYNGFVRGNAQLEAFGIPIGVVFDLGTDLPVRGQRNMVRFTFNTPKVVEKGNWDNVQRTELLQKGLDSLELAQGANQRKLLGQRARLKGLLELQQDSIPEYTGTDQQVNRSVDQDSLTTTIDHDDAHTAPTPPNSETDWSGIQRNILDLEQKSTKLDTLVAEQRRLLLRQKALSKATSGKVGFLKDLARGVKRFDIGSCAPNSSEFLINGINFQGLSFEFARKEFYLSVDHGRSFDDTWKNSDPVANDLRKLQRSLFFSDAQDLNPRKLTAVKAGVGSIDGTHFHVGYLHGQRDDIPVGLFSSGPTDIHSVNHVIELDAGHTLWKHHAVRLIYARSVVAQSGSGSSEETVQRPGVGDLFNSKTDQNEAIKLRWTSELPRLGARIEAEGRTIDPYFHSFGMGFIRNGSRAMELRWDQRFGDRLRIKVRGVLEDRALPSVAQPGHMDIQRGLLALNYRPTRALTIRGSYSPVRTITHQNTEMARIGLNQAWSVGSGLRQRWKKTTLLLDLDGTLYTWVGSESVTHTAMNQVVTLSLNHGARWQFISTYSTMERLDNDTLPSTSNMTFQAGYTTHHGLKAMASIQVPKGSSTGWTCTVKQSFGEHYRISIQCARYARFDTFFLTVDPSYESVAYTCSLAIQYLW